LVINKEDLFTVLPKRLHNSWRIGVQIVNPYSDRSVIKKWQEQINVATISKKRMNLYAGLVLSRFLGLVMKRGVYMRQSGQKSFLHGTCRQNVENVEKVHMAFTFG
jgi:hypothetical protein